MTRKRETRFMAESNFVIYYNSHDDDPVQSMAIQALNRSQAEDKAASLCSSMGVKHLATWSL